MTKTMKKLMTAALAVAALSFGASAQPPAGSPVAIHGKLSVGGPDGNQIVDQHGSPIALRGMSFFWNTSGWGGDVFYTTGAVNTLVDDWKVDVVRVAIDPAATQSTNWQTVVNQAIAKGIYVIIDFHAHSHNLQSQAVTFFQNVSTTYKNVPNVIYEIFNEPCSNSPGTNGGGGCTGDNWSQHIKPYAVAVVNAIRSNGCDNVIIIGTPDFSKRVDQAAADRLTATNLAYAVHFYTAESGTHHTSTLISWSGIAYNAGIALYVSEFGISEANGDGRIDTTWANTWFDWLDARQIGWANWSINTKNESASALTGGASTDGSNWSSNLSTSGRFIRNKLRYYANRYKLTQTKTGNGTFTVFPDFNNTSNYPANYGYQPGTPIRLSAEADPGYTFIGFETGEIGLGAGTTSNPVVTSMGAADRTVTAVFEKDGNIVKNGTFTANILQWGAAGATLGYVNHTLEVAISSAGSTPDAVQVRQTGLDSLRADKEYLLTFRARAAANRNITVLVTTSSASTIVDSQTVALTTEWQTRSIPVSVRALNPNRPSFTNGGLRFNAGGSDVNWYLDDVRLEEVGTSTSVSQGPVAGAARAAAPFRAVQSGRAITLNGAAGSSAEVTLYDLSGRVRFTRTVRLSGGTTLSLDRLPAGVYTARYRVDGVVKQNDRVVLGR